MAKKPAPVNSNTVFVNRPPRQVYDPSIGGGGGQPSGGFRPSPPRPGRTPEPGPTFGQPEPGISPIPWNPNGPRTRNTPFGQNVPSADGDGGGGGGGGAAPNPYSNQTRNAIAVMKGILERYGLGTLYNKIVEFAQNGYDTDSILALIRDTPEYKERFPAMDALAKKGRGISEAEYIAYEAAASGYERMYGLPAGMLGKDAVTNLLSNEVSAKELEDRVVMASTAAASTAKEVQDSFQEYYGIGPGGLTAYFLDPEKATPLLQKQYASSRIGGEAKMQGIGVDRSLAEELTLAGISSQDARAGFAKVAGQGELSSGRGDVVSQGELIQGNLLQNEEAQKNLERASLARTGRFQGGGGFAGNERGASGLRTASS